MTDIDQPAVQDNAESKASENEDLFAQEEASAVKPAQPASSGEAKGLGAVLLLTAVALGLFVFAVIAAFKFNVVNTIIAGSDFLVTGEQIISGVLPEDECLSTITATLIISVVCAIVGAALTFITLFASVNGKKTGAFIHIINFILALVGLVCAFMVHSNSEYKWGYAGNLGITLVIVFAVIAVLSVLMILSSSEKKIHLTAFGKKITVIVAVVVVIALVLGISIPVSLTRSSATNAGNVARVEYGDDYYTIEGVLGTPYESDDTSDMLVWFDKDTMERYEQLSSDRLSAQVNIEDLTEQIEAEEDAAKAEELNKQLAEEQDKLAKAEEEIAALPESAAASTVIFMEDGSAVGIALDANVNSEEEKSASSTVIKRVYVTDSVNKTCVVLYELTCTDGSMYLMESHGTYERSGSAYNVTFTNVLGKSNTVMKLAVAF